MDYWKKESIFHLDRHSIITKLKNMIQREKNMNTFENLEEENICLEENKTGYAIKYRRAHLSLFFPERSMVEVEPFLLKYDIYNIRRLIDFLEQRLDKKIILHFNNHLEIYALD